jgi:hypothetical protein
MRQAGNMASMEEMSNAYRGFIRKSEKKSLLQRSSCRLEDNIKSDTGEQGMRVCTWVHLTQSGIQWFNLWISVSWYKRLVEMININLVLVVDSQNICMCVIS